MLNQSHYEVCSTFFNISFGDDLESSILKAVSVSRTFVVFVCDNYHTDVHCVIEFDGIWAFFKCQPGRQLIIVNMNSYESNLMNDRKIKAFVRLGLDLNFTERDSKPTQRLRSRIGKPSCKTSNSESSGFNHNDVDIKVTRRADIVVKEFSDMDFNLPGTSTK
ncbi:hypothetical protein DPMN_104169 [Dreissena polymorpha]|uniref:TIR domain-containing protein n=1 Tax=Dreissena polymorpha TaxID=45954 RepID=A0A9D4K2X5_DREPO|nr:hypothetical protein DPMN_104169 [Dreissena polymorpha]